jgi:hypothetical protein
MNSIPDFTEAERKCVTVALIERYGKIVPLQLADSELQLGGDLSRLTVCPTLYWNELGAHFVVCKVAPNRYRCQFFYSDAGQYGTGQEEYDNLETCVLTLLQIQQEHARLLSNISSGATAAKFDVDDDVPLVV